MQPNTRQRFQGKCYLGDEGHRYMQNNYDELPPETRSRLQSSAFNICSACVYDEAIRHREGNFMAAIDHIEAAVLAEYGPFGPQPVNPAPLVARPRRNNHGIPRRTEGGVR